MPTFLDIVANDLYIKKKGDLSSTTIIFPNKRASLFFNKALAALTDKPMWCPQYTTISELFRNHSKLECGDRIKLVCELYLSYKEVTGSDEPLDRFYSWGELMLNDFDDIDKHQANAEKIFTLLSDIHELDGVEYLTDNQQKVLQRFFSNFSKEHNTELKKRFLQLWKKLKDIYTNYRERLKKQGIAYEGMLYRDVIENELENISYKDEHTLVFVGFNLLHEVEMQLFSFFNKKKIAKFYWDYDAYYMNGHEAGKYISQYLKYFPNELDTNNKIYHNFGKQKDVTFISSPTEDLQARYIAQWLTPERIEAGRHTAIVLADEGLLETVLHCLPTSVKNVNITTGYPLEKSPAASLVRLMMTLLLHKSYTLHNVNAILRHPLIKYVSERTQELHTKLNSETIYYPSYKDLAIDERLTCLFEPLHNRKDCHELCKRLMWVIKTIAANAPQTDDFSQEALYRMYTIINRIKGVIPADCSISLYQGLLQQVIATTTIPFHGEPIEGIQIMGVLETRNLDFEHLLLLSCNEGKLPAKINDSSYIPHAVRIAHGLTTIDNKVAIYAYYFHRLLQRTNDAHILYNNSTNSGHTGEMSRFMLQLIAESNLHITRKSLDTQQETASNHPKEKEKTTEIVDALICRGYFSPSALGLYLRCPLKFFYKYVSGIKDEIAEDEEDMDARVFGNIFHKAAENLYKDFVGRNVTREYIDSIKNEKGLITLQRIVDQAFRTELFLIKDNSRPMPRLNGLQTINREMIITFLCHLLEYDKKNAPFEILALEEDVYDKININIETKTHEIRIGGKIDRIDSYTDAQGVKHIRVIDYKTGRTTKEFNLPSVDSIFDPENIKNHSDYYLQALMYSGIVSKGYSLPTSPNLFYVQQISQEKYNPLMSIDKQPILDINNYISEYNENLKQLISNILDKEIPFKPTEYPNRCEGCVYAAFCR